MDKRELSQLKHLSKEIELLKKQLDGAEYLAETRTTADYVTGSSSAFPYVKHAIKIAGVDIKDYEKRVQRLKNSLERQIETIMDRVAEMQEYIATVPDSETRLILQCRYINGLTWEQIEDETGINYRTAKRKYRRWQGFS